MIAASVATGTRDSRVVAIGFHQRVRKLSRAYRVVQVADQSVVLHPKEYCTGQELVRIERGVKKLEKIKTETLWRNKSVLT